MVSVSAANLRIKNKMTLKFLLLLLLLLLPLRSPLTLNALKTLLENVPVLSEARLLNKPVDCV